MECVDTSRTTYFTADRCVFYGITFISTVIFPIQYVLVSCSDDYVYQCYPINLFGGVPVSIIGSVVCIAWLGAVAVRVRTPVEAISFSIFCRIHLPGVWNALQNQSRIKRSLPNFSWRGKIKVYISSV
jgi:hypothetical protein